MAPLAPDLRLPIWARPATLWAVVLAVALAQFVVSARTNLVFDEAYYTLWSFNLAGSYLDHPPMVAWMIAIGRAIAGDNEIGVRLMPILCGLGVAGAIYRIGIILFDARVAALAVIWHALSAATALGFVMTPDPPSALFWVLTLWAVAEFMYADNRAWWLVAGLMAGLGLASKLTDLMLPAGLLVFMLASAERRQWFRLWQVWAAPVIALLVFSPVIVWNAANGWDTFLFQGRRTVEGGPSMGAFLANFAELLAGQALAVGPALAILAVVGALAFLLGRGDRARPGLALGLLTALPLLAYFTVHATHARVEANWLLPVWPGLTLCAAWAGVHLRPRGWRGALAALGRWSQVPFGAVLMTIIYVQALAYPFSGVAFDRTRDLHGWRELFAEVSQTAGTNGARWIATASDYRVTGELATYGRFAGDPLPVRQIDEPERYRFRPPFDPGGMGWPALYVQAIAGPDARRPPTRLFGSAQFLGVTTRVRGSEAADYFEMYLVSDPTEAFLAAGN